MKTEAAPPSGECPFVLKVPEAGGGDAYTTYQVVDLREGPLEKCAGCGGPLAQPRWLPPHKVRLFCSTGALNDVAFGPRADLLVTQAFRAAWVRRGLGGLLGFRPVEVVDVASVNTFVGDAPPFFLAEVVRSQAALDEKESEVERTGGRPCEVCGMGGVLKHLRRVVLRGPPPAGVDLYLARGLATAVLASGRFARAVAEERLSGCLLVPADQVRAL